MSEKTKGIAKDLNTKIEEAILYGQELKLSDITELTDAVLEEE